MVQTPAGWCTFDRWNRKTWDDFSNDFPRMRHLCSPNSPLQQKDKYTPLAASTVIICTSTMSGPAMQSANSNNVPDSDKLDWYVHWVNPHGVQSDGAPLTQCYQSHSTAGSSRFELYLRGRHKNGAKCDSKTTCRLNLQEKQVLEYAQSETFVNLVGSRALGIMQRRPRFEDPNRMLNWHLKTQITKNRSIDDPNNGSVHFAGKSRQYIMSLVTTENQTHNVVCPKPDGAHHWSARISYDTAARNDAGIKLVSRSSTLRATVTIDDDVVAMQESTGDKNVAADTNLVLQSTTGTLPVTSPTALVEWYTEWIKAKDIDDGERVLRGDLRCTTFRLSLRGSHEPDDLCTRGGFCSHQQRAWDTVSSAEWADMLHRAAVEITQRPHKRNQRQAMFTSALGSKIKDTGGNRPTCGQESLDLSKVLCSRASFNVQSFVSCRLGGDRHSEVIGKKHVWCMLLTCNTAAGSGRLIPVFPELEFRDDQMLISEGTVAEGAARSVPSRHSDMLAEEPSGGPDSLPACTLGFPEEWCSTANQEAPENRVPLGITDPRQYQISRR